MGVADRAAAARGREPWIDLEPRAVLLAGRRPQRGQARVDDAVPGQGDVGVGRSDRLRRNLLESDLTCGLSLAIGAFPATCNTFFGPPLNPLSRNGLSRGVRAVCRGRGGCVFASISDRLRPRYYNDLAY